MTCRNLVFAFLATGCFVANLSADVTGTISGIVRDSSQAIVVGARVSAINIETNFTRESVSGSDGEYRLLALPPGHYRVSATAAGFEQFVATGINLQVNDELHVDATLRVGAVKEAVTVEANPVQVETESTQLGQVIGTKQILSLPLNGRSFIDLLGLQAGVAPVTSGSIQQDRPVDGILSAGNVSVNGQRETANAFLVNGGDVSEGRNNGAGLIPNLDSIQEFRLITNSFDAEYGKFSGSVMNAITKSGTNGFHGDVFEFLRNDKFDARGFFDPTKAELRRNQFGYAAGGPFIRNKLFWFTDYQGTRQVRGASTGLVSVPTPDQRAGIFDPGAFIPFDRRHHPRLLGPLSVAFLKLAPTKTFSILIGKPPSLIGAEYTFDFENMNIERGLLWNQENSVNRGVQVNDTFGKLTASLSWNDGFYSNRYTWLTGSLGYPLNVAHTLTFVAGGNAR